MLRLPLRPAWPIIAIAIIGLVCWLLLGREQAPPATSVAQASVGADGTLKLEPVQAEALGLETAEASQATTLPVGGLPAEVAPPLDSSARVAVPYGGVVTRILRDEGDVVAAGDALVRIQSRELLTAQAELARARSEALAATQQARRDAQLLKEGIISAARNDASQARAASAEALRQQAEGALSGLRIVSGGVPGVYELLAPIAGRVLHRRVVPGQAVAPLEETYAVAAPGSLDIIFSVAVGSRVAPGMEVRLPDGSSGRVVAVGADTDRTSQRLRVRARADDDRGLIAGQHLELTLLVPAPADAVSVPASSLLTEGKEHVLYVLDGEGYRAVRVERLGGDSEYAVIRGHLQPGERVVARGASALKALIAAE